MRTATPLILVAAIGGGLLASAPTYAYDQKAIAPVSACIAYGPGTVATELQFSPSGIYNPGTTGEKVVCSMPRDQAAAYTSNQVAVIVNYRVLGATAAKVTCTLFVGSAQQQTQAVFTDTQSGNPAGGGEQGSVVMTGATQQIGYTSVPVALVCVIPAKTWISRISLEEFGGTGS